jgi:hypothetical protein
MAVDNCTMEIALCNAEIRDRLEEANLLRPLYNLRAPATGDGVTKLCDQSGQFTSTYTTSDN